MIDIDALTIRPEGGGPAVLGGLDLSLGPGERIAVVGESGSGKTTLALAMLGAMRPGLRTEGGRLLVDGQDVLSLSGRRLQRFRREVISYLPQDPASALTPSMRVRPQLSELAGGGSRADIAEQLTAVGLPGDPEFQKRYPHQISGGQRQRLAIARALSGQPRVLVLDEPTTGLDAQIQQMVLQTLDEEIERRGLALVFITHDLRAARRMAPRVAVLHRGQVVEDGPSEQVLTRPSAEYTRELVASVPDLSEAAGRAELRPVPPLLEIREITAGHQSGRTGRTVVDAVSLQVGRQECVALVGGSGSGKTTLLRCVNGLHHPVSGQVLMNGRLLQDRIRDRTVADRKAIQLIGQDPAGSLNPRRSVGAAIERPLRTLRGLDGPAAAAERDRLLTAVGLDPELAGRRPHLLSGGQQQRVAIARALAGGPDILLCDEVTSNLDVRVQAAIIELLLGLMHSEDIGVLLVTHDLGVVARLADRVLILAGGQIREQGAAGQVLLQPRDQVTRELVAAAAGAETARPPGGTALPAESSENVNVTIEPAPIWSET